jgi:hypothetical protein
LMLYSSVLNRRTYFAIRHPRFRNGTRIMGFEGAVRAFTEGAVRILHVSG